MTPSTIDTPDAFKRLYEQAIEVSSALAAGDSPPKDTHPLHAGLVYKSKLDALRTQVEKLPSLTDLEQELLPQGLGDPRIEITMDSNLRTIWTPKLVPRVPLNVFLWQLGFYHDIFDRKPQEIIWGRIHRMLNETPINIYIWMNLAGCILPEGGKFSTPDGLIVNVARIRSLFHARTDREFDARYPDYDEFDPRIYVEERQWGLLTTYTVERTAVSYFGALESDPPPTRDRLIADSWPDLLALALCHSGFLNVESILEKVPDLEARGGELAHYESTNSPFRYPIGSTTIGTMRGAYGDDLFVIPAEKQNQFANFLMRIGQAIETNGQEDHELVEAARYTLEPDCTSTLSFIPRNIAMNVKRLFYAT
jgi:hypothetical protein